MPSSDVLRLLAQFRAALAKQDEAALRQVVDAYRLVYDRLGGRIDALILAAGDVENMTGAKLIRLKQYAALEEQLSSELADFGVVLKSQVTSAAKAALLRGDVDAYRLLNGIYSAHDYIRANFARMPWEAIQTMIGFLQADSPLYKAIYSMSGYYTEQVMQGLVSGIALGDSPRVTAAKLADLFTQGLGRGLTDALRITRTAQLYSYREANRANFVLNSDVVSGWIWIADMEGDPPPCLSCIAQNGTRHDLDENLDDHDNGRAEVPDNIILTDNVTALETLRYNGDIIVISATSGKFLSVTPNHPVLTRRGWIAAKFIQIGDDVISNNGAVEGTSGMYPNEKHIPTRVQDIPSAFGMYRLGTMPKSAEDFYRKRIDGEVDVIYIDRLLWDGFNIYKRERIKESLLGLRFNNPIGLAGICRPTKAFGLCRPAPDRVLSCFYNQVLFGLGHSFIPEGVRRGQCMSGYFGLSKSASNYIPRNFESFRNRVFRNPGIVHIDNLPDGQYDLIPGMDGYFSALNWRSFGFIPEQSMSLEKIREFLLASMPETSRNLRAITGDVIFDRVIKVGVRNFTGHVYSLQTKQEWYYSNSIVSHNCAQVPEVLGQNPIENMQSGEDYFNSLSEEEQLALMGPGKFEAWQNNKFTFDQLSVERDHPTWGMVRTEATLKDLVGSEEG